MNNDVNETRSQPKLFPGTKLPGPLAPAWVALLAAWVGLACLALSIVVPFVPGSRNMRKELTHEVEYSTADRLLVVALYASPASIFLGIIVLWHMRRQPRPLPDALVAQRVQAWTGIVLGLAGAAVIYVFVWLRGPGAAG